jgi:hypothetical protein
MTGGGGGRNVAAARMMQPDGYSGLTLDLPDCKPEPCHCFNAVLGV